MTEQGGILCIDKPEGFTSFDVVAKLRGIARERRVGHAGTLDPMATGVLPLFFGRATKACDILPQQDKRYLASFKLGVTTDTQDITGTVLSEQTPDADEARVRAAAAGLVGDIMQTPPMYSAVRVNGQRLYELARRGVEVERAARPVTVYSIDFTVCDVQANAFTIDVHCSKGTYIRTLIADIGAALGCGAVMTALRRIMAAGFTLADCVTIEQAQQAAQDGAFGTLLRPVETAFGALPRVVLNEKQTKMFLNGVRLDMERVACKRAGDTYAVYAHNRRFLGVAREQGGLLCMQKLFTLEV
ncbi:tRNA pseudouridine(55) synthase TruB [Anaerotruncus colihominis]|uniref:tRNA pseudouridine synthase B n=1 Tax=Anaerotruncus colihominis TaxID=169435 RepID=A0A845SMM6_9FIRM|nr:tRNA pseudouridine(55) synthase TruB [Anaerotruncus colihominis]MCR2026803.1 tRNA pseudouridine(55) synthase TruB [Anaerotruncus colihominis]NDO37686.1 tRNA pseudouridine(55) synthase TruB [Anaerotruncus colihominis]